MSFRLYDRKWNTNNRHIFDKMCPIYLQPLIFTKKTREYIYSKRIYLPYSRVKGIKNMYGIKLTPSDVRATFLITSLYRPKRNITWWGTKITSTPPYNPNGLSDYIIWGIILFLSEIEVAPPWRFSNFYPWPEIWPPPRRGVDHPEGQKNWKKIFFLIFFF